MNIAFEYDGWINACKLRQWDVLENSIEYPCVNIDFKILFRATFDTYHRERKNELDALTIRLLEDKFSSNTSIYGLVHLGDFVSAYRLAKDEVKDVRIAEKISDYVKKNAKTLGLMLAAEDVSSNLKDFYLGFFPFLKQYRKDKVKEPETCVSESSSDLSSSSDCGIEPHLLDYTLLFKKEPENAGVFLGVHRNNILLNQPLEDLEDAEEVEDVEEENDGTSSSSGDTEVMGEYYDEED